MFFHSLPPLPSNWTNTLLSELTFKSKCLSPRLLLSSSQHVSSLNLAQLDGQHTPITAANGFNATALSSASARPTDSITECSRPMSGQHTVSAGTMAVRMWTKPQVIAVYTSYLLINFTCQVNCLHPDLKNTPVSKNREPQNSPKPHIFERHPNSPLPMCFSFAYPKTSSVSLVLQLFCCCCEKQKRN